MGKPLEKYVVQRLRIAFFFIIYTGHTSDMNIDWSIIVQYYIICKVTISLSLLWYKIGLGHVRNISREGEIII